MGDIISDSDIVCTQGNNDSREDEGIFMGGGTFLHEKIYPLPMGGVCLSWTLSILVGVW